MTIELKTVFFASSQISLRSAARHCDCFQHFLSGSAGHATLPKPFLQTFCPFSANFSRFNTAPFPALLFPKFAPQTSLTFHLYSSRAEPPPVGQGSSG